MKPGPSRLEVEIGQTRGEICLVNWVNAMKTSPPLALVKTLIRDSRKIAMLFVGAFS